MAPETRSEQMSRMAVSSLSGARISSRPSMKEKEWKIVVMPWLTRRFSMARKATARGNTALGRGSSSCSIPSLCRSISPGRSHRPPPLTTGVPLVLSWRPVSMPWMRPFVTVTVAFSTTSVGVTTLTSVMIWSLTQGPPSPTYESRGPTDRREALRHGRRRPWRCRPVSVPG